MSVITVKADVEKGIIYIDGWRESEKAKSFLKKAKDYFYVPFKGFEADLSKEGGYNRYRFLHGIWKAAEWTKTDVDKSVDELYEKFKAEYTEWRMNIIADLIAQERKKEIERGKKEGCRNCGDCTHYGDGDFYCEYAKEDLNFGIGEDYDGVRNIHRCFVDKPIPTANCKRYTDEYLMDSIKDKIPDRWGM